MGLRGRLIGLTRTDVCRPDLIGPGQILSPCKRFVCFVALRPKSTAMVMAGQLVHLTTLFPGQALTIS